MGYRDRERALCELPQCPNPAYRLRNAGGAASTFREALTRIFISYSSKDLDRANEIRAYLSAHGVDCWLARDDVPPGASWGEAIVEALGASDALVLVYSAHANVSQQVERELALAFEDGIPIVPFRTDDSHVSDGIRYYTREFPWLAPKADDPGQQLVALHERLLRHPLEPRRPTAARVASASMAIERVSVWFQSAARIVLVVGIIRLAIELLMVVNIDRDFDEKDAREYLVFFLPIHAAPAGAAVGFFLVWFAMICDAVGISGRRGSRSWSVAAAFLFPGLNVVAGARAVQELWNVTHSEPVWRRNGWDVLPQPMTRLWWILASVSVIISLHAMFVAANSGAIRPLMGELLIGSLCISIATIGARRFVRAIERSRQTLESAPGTHLEQRRAG